jgi:hypothetical protein
MLSRYAIATVVLLSISLLLSFLALINKEAWANNSFNIPILVSVLWGILQIGS